MITCWIDRVNEPTVSLSRGLAPMVVPLQLISDHAIMFTYDAAA